MAQNITRVILILVFVLAAVFAAAQVQAAQAPASASPAPETSDWFHNPEPWLEMGADFRFREHYGYNWTALNRDKIDNPTLNNEDNQFHFERYRTRWWTKSKCDENNWFNTRMTWEFRTWDNPESKPQETDFDEIIIDNLNYTSKSLLGCATTIIGRQDIFLGSGWLVADGTPLDGSRTFYYDALRLTWDLGEKTKLDTIYIHNEPESEYWLKPINDRDKYVTQQQEEGAIAYLTDKSTPTNVEAYFMYKNNNPVEPITGKAFNFPAGAVRLYSKNAEIYTFGGALSGPLCGNNWSYRVEGAVQFGHSASPNPFITSNENEEDLLAFGQKSYLEYAFKDECDNRLRLTYEYLTGDDPESDTVESFNPLWGQWPQWSELYQPYVTQLEDNLVSNLHRVAFGHKFKPNAQWEFLTDYHLLYADENTYRNDDRFSNSGNFRGHLLTAWARYTCSKQLKGNLIFEHLWPGGYYGSNNNDNALYFHFTVEYTF